MWRPLAQLTAIVANLGGGRSKVDDWLGLVKTVQTQSPELMWSILSDSLCG